PHRLQRTGAGARGKDASDDTEPGHPQRERGSVRPSHGGPARRALDGNGDDSPRATDRAAGDRRIPGALRGAKGPPAADPASAGIVLTAAFEYGGLARSRRGWTARKPSWANGSWLMAAISHLPISHSALTSGRRRRRRLRCEALPSAGPRRPRQSC